MASQSYSILSPPVVTRIMQETRDGLTLPMPLRWYARANMPNVSDDEMTLKESGQIFAADIISADAKAHIRESGAFSFAQFTSNKIKHGWGINETMLKLLRRLSAGKAMDNEYFSFNAYIQRQARKLEIGAQQRVETMINAMLVDGFTYNRLGIQLTGSWGMPADLKFNPVAAWRNADGTVNVAARPLADITNALLYSLRHYGEAYNRISMTFSALQAMVKTTEFKDTFQGEGFKYAQTSDAGTNARSASPMFHLDFIGNFISDSLRMQTGMNSNGTENKGRQVQFEVCEEQYREYSESSNILANGFTPFHPGQGTLIFTNTEDDNTSNGWDVGNGECIEGLMASMGGSAVIDAAAFAQMGTAYGPLGYMTQADVHLNPAGMAMWNVRWNAPRKHRDTCSAKLTAFN